MSSMTSIFSGFFKLAQTCFANSLLEKSAQFANSEMTQVAYAKVWNHQLDVRGTEKAFTRENLRKFNAVVQTIPLHVFRLGDAKIAYLVFGSTPERGPRDNLNAFCHAYGIKELAGTWSAQWRSYMVTIMIDKEVSLIELIASGLVVQKHPEPGKKYGAQLVPVQGTMGLGARGETIMHYRDNNICSEMKRIIYNVLRNEGFHIVPTGSVGLRKVGIFADAVPYPHAKDLPDKNGIVWTTEHPLYRTMKMADIKDPIFQKRETKQDYQDRVWEVIKFGASYLGVLREVCILPGSMRIRLSPRSPVSQPRVRLPVGVVMCPNHIQDLVDLAKPHTI